MTAKIDLPSVEALAAFLANWAPNQPAPPLGRPPSVFMQLLAKTMLDAGNQTLQQEVQETSERLGR